jgi:hypothetical protein
MMREGSPSAEGTSAITLKNSSSPRHSKRKSTGVGKMRIGESSKPSTVMYRQQNLKHKNPMEEF